MFRETNIKLAKIIRIHQTTASKLSDLFFYLDTGYSKVKSLKMIETMYRFKGNDIDSKIFDVILLETVK